MRCINTMDFCNFEPHCFTRASFARAVVVGNPPFGKTLPEMFLKHALTFAELVVLVVGQSRRKLSYIGRVDARLVEEFLPSKEMSTFTCMHTGERKHVPVVVQFWHRGARTAVPRLPVACANTLLFAHSLRYCFVSKTNIGKANVLVRRLGSVNTVGQSVMTARRSLMIGRGKKREMVAMDGRKETIVRARAATASDFMIVTDDAEAFADLVRARRHAIRRYVGSCATGNNPNLSQPEFAVLLASPSLMERTWTVTTGE